MHARPNWSRSLQPALVLLGVVVLMLSGLAIVLVVDSVNGPTWVLVLFVLVALIYAGAGLVAWSRRPGNRLGLVMICGALAWVTASLINCDVPALVAVGLVVATVPFALVVHLLHAFPSGRLPDLASRLTVYGAYLTTIVGQIPLYIFVSTPGAPAGLVIAERPDLAARGALIQSSAGVVVMGATTVILLLRLRRADPTQRRVLGPLFAYGVLAVLFVPLSANVFERLLGLDPIWRAVLQLVVLGGVPVAFVLGVLRGGFRHTGGIEELGTWLGSRGVGRPGLREALASTLGDSSLELVFWESEREQYVDVSERSVALPAADSSRGLVEIELAGRRVGAITYDATLIADPETIRGAGRVVALALDHERLAAVVLASRDALRSSRARIVEAGDHERRRIAQDLHDGIQVQLVVLALKAYAIGDDPTASDSVRRSASELRAGIDGAAGELRRFVHGVMPALLIERGLFAATEDLVDQMPIPTGLELAGDDRGLPDTVQSTAYFAISEGLTNAVRHSGAQRLSVQLNRKREALHIEIRDDGVGGAAPGRGAGLRGMADRLDVLGGTLHVDSSPRGGTLLQVEVPCGS